jgi:adenylate cyclase class 2
MIEVECRVKIKDEKKFEGLREKLKNNMVKKSREVDTYYYPPHKDFIMTSKGREYLRIREVDDKNELTHKNAIYENGKHTHSIEKSISFTDANMLKEILNILGFRVLLTVDKLREIFEDDDFIITLDSVNKLGNFIEIEKKGKIDDIKAANSMCWEKAKELGIKNLEFCPIGYVQMLEQLNQEKQKKMSVL